MDAKLDLLSAGDAAYDMDELPKALDHYHRASLLDKEDTRVWCALAMTYHALEFTREAWRSYLLAISAAPEDPDTLWYASEFLIDVGDTQLAALLLQRYIAVEQDEKRLIEAKAVLEGLATQDGVRDLSTQDLTAVGALLSNEVSSRPLEEGGPAHHAAVVDEESGLMGHSESADTEFADEEAEEYVEAEEGMFIAPLALQLSGFGAACKHCAAAMPVDAPYCHSCLMPHFYEEE